MLEDRRILVTGASGFVGSHVVEAVARLGGTPYPMLRKASTRKGLEQWSENFRIADVREPESLRAAVRGMDVVIHAAGLTRARSQAEFDAVNAEGVAALVEACAGAAPALSRFVHVSSAAASGPSGEGAPLAEEAPAAPVTDYGRSKLLGEQRLRGSAEGRVAWTIVRPPIVYGPRERDLLAVFRMCRRGLVPVLRRGRTRYSLVFGPDLAEALVRLAVHPDAAHGTFFVCEREDYAYGEIVRSIGAAVGRVPLMPPMPALAARLAAALASLTGSFRKRPPLISLGKLPEILAPGWVVDASRARGLIGDVCRTPFPEGARLTAAWYRAQGWI